MRWRGRGPRRAVPPPIVLAACALLACGESPGEGGRDPFHAEEDPRVVRVMTPDTSDPLERDPPVVRVLVSHDATNYFVDAGQQRGLEYELMRDLEGFLRRRMPDASPPPRVVFVALRFDELISSLLAGRGDVVAAGLTVTEERSRKVAFSEPYRKEVREVVVRHEDAEPVGEPKDLAGRVVHVVRGSSYAEHLRELGRRLDDEGLEPPEVVEADAWLRSEDLLEMVHAGIYEQTVVDDHIATLWERVLDDVVVEDVAIHEGGHLAWAARPGDEALLAALDAYARRRRQGTLLGNVLFRRYYEDTRWVENPTAPVARGRLQRVADVLREAADRHDFDWLALAAVAFQESRFDPEARSDAGAVGIMQIRPETAADPNVGVEGVEDSIEANVEAATRYLAFLRERYFDSPDIAPADRFDFVLAAYNAGPARVQALRREATERGLDPDRWFGHVEHVARARIGSETVRYVSNVDKIYLALSSVRHQLEARRDALQRHGGA